MPKPHAVKPLSHLGHLPVQTFLNDYWQKKPVFIPQAIPHWQAPLDGDELAGLALEHSIESRLIIETPSSNPLKSQWHMEHGPLPEERFGQLPPSHFTLLIQALDQICPQINQLLNDFKFLPHWRIDDVMASIAPTGGSVGPHFDYYDVFLLQGTGSRQWKIGQQCTSESPLAPDCPLKILTEFNEEAQYLATPGDLLYIPANTAHWGVAASDDCTTYSIGFRAPSYSDILLELSQEIASELSADIRYRDPENLPANLGGEIPQSVIHTIAQRCQDYFSPNNVANWLGQHLTEQTREAPEVITGEFKSETYVLAPTMRAAYTQYQPTQANQDGNTANTQQALVFINGQQWQTSLSLACALCDYTVIEPSNYSAQDCAAIQLWIEHGYINVP